MSFFSRMQEKHRGIENKSVIYYEISYKREGRIYYVCILAKDLSHAKVKAKYVQRERKGSKLIEIKKLDQNNLASSLTWNKRDWNG